MNRTKGLIWAKKVGFAALIILLPLISIHSALADSLKQNFSHYDTGIWDSTGGNYLSLGQTFTANSTYNLTSISLRINEKNAADYIDVWLYDTAAGVPNTELAYYGRYNLAVGNNTIRWQNFTNSSPYTIVIGEVYALVFGAGDTTQDMQFMLDLHNGYSDGSAYNGATRPPTSVYSSNDFNFMLYGNATIIPQTDIGLTIVDEISLEPINETVEVEFITNTTASNYTTINGYLNVTVNTSGEYTIRYRGSSYAERDIYDSFVFGVGENLTLYSLAFADSKDLIITVKDTGADPIENALIKLLRYYVDCNCYRVVEMAYTDYSGKAWLSAEPYEGHYKISVDYNDINYFLSSSPTNYIPDPVYDWYTQTITINLDTDFYESWRALTGLGDLLVYNDTTKALSYTWSDPSGLTTRACLEVNYVSGARILDYQESCQNASVGSVVIVLNNTATTSYKYHAHIDTSTTYSDHTRAAGWIRPDPTYDFGVFGAFMGAFIIAGLALLFSFSAIAVLIITFIGTVVMALLGFFPVGQSALLGFGVLILGMSVYLYRRRY